MKKLRDYQVELSKQGVEKLKQLGVVYYAVEVRCGKTSIALETCRLFGAKKVLFLTKKKAISSIEDDYKDFGFTFDLTVINNESLHKIKDNDFDVVIGDEFHRVGGSFPKPSKMAKDFRARFFNTPLIFLSGTPNPESYSQIYHQFWVSKFSPFIEKNFYRWADNYVKVFQVNYGYGNVNDYSKANESKIRSITDKYFITYTQKQSGFETVVKENFLSVEMKQTTHNLADKLIKDRVIESNVGTILSDTAVKLQGKLHQIYSGTIKFEEGNAVAFDLSKAEYIKDYFKENKIGIFYKFIAELDALKQVFGDSLTTDLEEFNATDKNIALQIVSGREGISLRNADYLVYYNIDFSAVSYFQSKDRMSTIDRLTNDIYWVFSKGGIEEKIYKAVSKKKNYTNGVFKRQYKIE